MKSHTGIFYCFLFIHEIKEQPNLTALFIFMLSTIQRKKDSSDQDNR